MSRITKVAIFTVTSLTPAAAFACAMFHVNSTYPLDYLVYGALAGAFGVGGLWSGETPTREAQLRRFGIWMLLSFAVGIAFATEYAIDLNFFSVNAVIASTFVLSGILFPGWRAVRRLFILLGFVIALPGACGFSCAGVGTNVGADHYSEVRFDDDREVEPVTF